MVYRETFLQIRRRLLQHLTRKSRTHGYHVSEHTSPHMMSASQTPVQDQRCQSRPSARNSVIPSEGGFSKNYGADQQRLQVSDPHFDKFPMPATFACWKIRFKTEVCTCWQVPTEAMLWIKEVELVDSVDDLKSSCSVRGIQMPNVEVLDAKIVRHWTESSSIPNLKERSVWRNKKPKKRTVSFVENGPLTWSANTSGSLEPTILSRIMPTYLHMFFEMMILRNSIQECGSLRNSRPYWNCTIWRFTRRKLDLITTDWRQW